MNNLYSFDIFDTLITRNCEKPTDVFVRMEERIQSEYKVDYFNDDIYNCFSYIRLLSERILLGRYDKSIDCSRSYKLHDIYLQLAETQLLSSNKAKELENFELQMEKELSLPIWKGIHLVEELVWAGEHVVLISDMYLTSSQIRELLLQYSDAFKNIEIYVSCEHTAQKSDGVLFDIVQRKEKAEFKNWHHYGDNYNGDFLIPRAFGIEAHLVEWKKDININHVSDHVRLSVPVLLKNKKGCYNNVSEKMGYEYGGPILFPYVLWCIKVALRENIADIYFIARDGFSLKVIADIIIKNKKCDIKTHYIYGSRTAWKDNKTNEKDYFEQEVDLYKQNMFVDLQGSGNSINSVFSIYNNESISEQVCVFFDKVAPTAGNKCRIIAFTDNRNTRYIELLGRAPHGLTITYKKDHKRELIVPQLQSIRDNERERINEYIEGIKRFVKDYYLDFVTYQLQGDLALISNECLRELGQCEDKEILECLFDLSFRDGLGEEEYSYAPRLSESDINKYLSESVLDDGSWYKGCNINSSISRCSADEKERIIEKKRRILIKPMPWGKPEIQWKIVLYGAGVNGQKDACCLYNTAKIEVVLWVDMNAEKAREQGLCVKEISAIHDYEYDYVLVSLADEDRLKGAKCILCANGVAEDKILSKDELREVVRRKVCD